MLLDLRGMRLVVVEQMADTGELDEVLGRVLPNFGVLRGTQQPLLRMTFRTALTDPEQIVCLTRHYGLVRPLGWRMTDDLGSVIVSSDVSLQIHDGTSNLGTSDCLQVMPVSPPGQVRKYCAVGNTKNILLEIHGQHQTISKLLVCSKSSRNMGWREYFRMSWPLSVPRVESVPVVPDPEPNAPSGSFWDLLTQDGDT